MSSEQTSPDQTARALEPTLGLHRQFGALPLPEYDSVFSHKSTYSLGLTAFGILWQIHTTTTASTAIQNGLTTTQKDLAALQKDVIAMKYGMELMEYRLKNEIRSVQETSRADMISLSQYVRHALTRSCPSPLGF